MAKQRNWEKIKAEYITGIVLPVDGGYTCI